MVRRLVLFLAAIALLASAGCDLGDKDIASTECRQGIDTDPAAMSTPVVAQVTKQRSNFVFDVTSSAPEFTRVTLAVGGQVALDVDVPGRPRACGISHDPIHRYYYRLPVGPVQVSVAVDGEQKDAERVVIGAKRQWSYAMIQTGFPVELTVLDRAPGWA